MPNSLLTFVIPVGPAHHKIYHEAVNSVEAQTVKCDYIVQQDTHGKGAGWSRNRALESVTTSLVAFLDADDIIEPTFAETCLGILSQYHASHDDPRYVYTDWIIDNVGHKAVHPCKAWQWGETDFHLVTTVLPTDAVRRIGGFDEVMTGVEDADFYVRLRLSGLCGIHVNAPLVHYREGGQRSIQARLSGQEILAKQYMTNRYGGYSLMGCCGNSDQHPLTPDNEPEPGDVLAQAQWQGNVRRLGLATGRMYLRTSYPKLLYMAPEDIKAAPHMWKAVSAPVQASNGVVLQPQYAAQSADIPWQQTMDAVFGGGNPQAPSKPIEYKPNTPGLKKTDVLAKGKSK